MNSNTFFKELKQYNSTNFRTLLKAGLVEDDAAVNKAFSSVVTRFFIFCEKHPEMTQTDRRVLYFKLKIDMISQFFAEYPEGSLDCLKPFQMELQSYAKKHGEED